MNLPKRITNTPPGMKMCGKCRKELPKNRDFFDRDNSKEDGFKSWCKQCRKERHELAQAKHAAELMKQLDMAVVLNLAQAKPGGTCVPHATEIYQSVMAIMGGVQGFAMHWAGTYTAAQPGSQTRERMLGGMLKLSQAVSDSNKVQMPAEMLTDEDLNEEVKRREERMKVIPAEFTEIVDDKETDQPDEGSRQSA